MTSAWDAWWSQHHPPQFPTDSYLELEESLPKDEPLVYVPPTAHIPPLPILHGLSLTIHERLKYMETQAAVFKVTVGLDGQQHWAILKVYHSDDPPLNIEGGPLLPGREIFNRESQAYANFIQYGLCRDGVVPHCYGIVKFPGCDLIQLETTTGCEDMFGPFRHDTNPPVALLIEYMVGMRSLKLLDLTEHLGNEIMKQAVHIHEAHVLHDDLEPRNILVGAEGRVVIIDFGSSASYPDPIATPPFFGAEYRGLWRDLFIRMALTKLLTDMSNFSCPTKRGYSRVKNPGTLSLSMPSEFIIYVSNLYHLVMLPLTFTTTRIVYNLSAELPRNDERVDPLHP